MKARFVLMLSMLAFALPAGAAVARPSTPVQVAAAGSMGKHAAKAGKMKTRTATSLACSKKANKMKIHGKKRKSFMSKCKKGKM